MIYKPVNYSSSYYLWIIKVPPQTIWSYHLTTNTSFVFNASWFVTPRPVLLVCTLMLSCFILILSFHFSQVIL